MRSISEAVRRGLCHRTKDAESKPTSPLMAAFEKARPFPGPKLYQKRASVVFPLLVEHALRGVPVTYTALANRVGMPNPRNLDYVLGSIGVTLERHGHGRIPPITGLVVNEHTRLPGKGGWGFLGIPEPKQLTRDEKLVIVEKARRRIHEYHFWPQVLHQLSLAPASGEVASLLDSAAQRLRGGESKDHYSLKHRVASAPELVGLSGFRAGETEYGIGSGDRLDVLFKSDEDWVAVEVKTAHAPDAEVARGLMQCVKYQAVLEAEARLIPFRRKVKHRTILFLARSLTPTLEAMRAALRVTVVTQPDVADARNPKA